VKKQAKKQDSKPVYEFFHFVVPLLMMSQVEVYKSMISCILVFLKTMGKQFVAYMTALMYPELFP